MGLRARKLIPWVPKLAALDCWGAPSNTLARQVISKSTKPVPSTTSFSSASSRAPAIQPVHKSICFLASSGTSIWTSISAICKRHPGLNTLYIASKAAALAGIRFSTPLEMTTSAQPSSTGSFSA